GPMPVRLLDLEQVGHSRIGQVVVFRARQRHSPQRIADGQSLASDILAGLQVVEFAAKGIAGKGRDLARRLWIDFDSGLPRFAETQEWQRLMMAGAALAMRRVVLGSLFENRLGTL